MTSATAVVCPFCKRSKSGTTGMMRLGSGVVIETTCYAVGVVSIVTLDRDEVFDYWVTNPKLKIFNQHHVIRGPGIMTTSSEFFWLNKTQVMPCGQEAKRLPAELFPQSSSSSSSSSPAATAAVVPVTAIFAAAPRKPSTGRLSAPKTAKTMSAAPRRGSPFQMGIAASSIPIRKSRQPALSRLIMAPPPPSVPPEPQFVVIADTRH